MVSFGVLLSRPIAFAFPLADLPGEDEAEEFEDGDEGVGEADKLLEEAAAEAVPLLPSLFPVPIDSSDMAAVGGFPPSFLLPPTRFVKALPALFGLG